MHRADLQGALQAQVNDNPDIDLRLGCQFEDVASHAKGLTVVQRSGNDAAAGTGGGADRRRRHLVGGAAAICFRRCSRNSPA